jgi:hypothetical protein
LGGVRQFMKDTNFVLLVYIELTEQ